jgi:hypothetical protein
MQRNPTRAPCPGRSKENAVKGTISAQWNWCIVYHNLERFPRMSTLKWGRTSRRAWVPGETGSQSRRVPPFTAMVSAVTNPARGLAR